MLKFVDWVICRFVYFPPLGPPLCWVWNVAWLNLPLWAPLGPKTLFDEKIEGLPAPKLNVGILGISTGFLVLFAI
jgi:hypothetical protein